MANKFYSIISRFAGNRLPEHVTARFAQWLVSPENSREKDQALRNWWNTISGSSPDEHTIKGLRELNREIDVFENVHRQKLLLRLSRIAAAAAVFITASILLFNYSMRPDDTVYLVTAENSKGYFQLPDSSRVWLNGNSELRYTKDFSRRNRQVHLTGEAFFDITKSDREFVVKTDYLDVTVHGTKFNVDCQPTRDYTEVALVEGSITVSGEGMGDIRLTPDKLLHRSKLNGSTSVSNIRGANFQRWTADRMVFFDTPATDIIQSISKWYNVRIFKEKNAYLDDIRLSMTVSTQSLQDILNYMTMVSDLDYTMLEDGSILISHK
ncbi:MAG: FecR family protein [Clostridium sp.]|nr:FecR family protein [Bacteroides sp.]MCM1197851.1 FecR family protein [Clostridium sp.]